LVVLDTNVLAELTRLAPSPEVVAWVDQFDAADIFVAAISKAEVKFGLETMPEGKRQRELAEKYERLFTTLLFRRVLPFDDQCTGTFARFAASAEKRGRGMSTADLQIAATAYCFNASVATRNVKDFDHEGLRVINPWTD
jgi:toxin FitB